MKLCLQHSYILSSRGPPDMPNIGEERQDPNEWKQRLTDNSRLLGRPVTRFSHSGSAFQEPQAQQSLIEVTPSCPWCLQVGFHTLHILRWKVDSRLPAWKRGGSGRDAPRPAPRKPSHTCPCHTTHGSVLHTLGTSRGREDAELTGMSGPATEPPPGNKTSSVVHGLWVCFIHCPH